MTVRDELRAHLNETGESMRSLSLRAGLNEKNVSDILSIKGLKPRHKTLAALSEATGRDFVSAAAVSKGLTFGELVDKLDAGGRKTHASRVRWIMSKANWYANRSVCRHEVIEFFARHNAASLGLAASSRSTYKSNILAAIDQHGIRNRPRGVADLSGIWADAYEASKESDIPGDCRLKAGPFFVFLFDRGIMPGEITTEILAEYYAYRLDVGVVTEPKCRKHVGNVVTLLAHLEKDPMTSRFGFKAVPTPFSDRRDKFGVEDTLIAEVMKEFDEQVTPWAYGDASRAGLSYEDFLLELDKQEADPVPKNKARLRKSVAAKANLPRKATKQERVERREAKQREFGFLPSEARWSERTTMTRRGYVVSLAKALVASHDVVVTSIAELMDPEYLVAAAEVLAESNGGKQKSGYVSSVLKTMKKIATGYVAMGTDDVDEIKALIRFYKSGGRGISPRNKSKLRQFTDERIQATIDLSGTILTGINKEIDRRRKKHRKSEGVLPRRIDVVDIEMARDIAAIVAHDILLTRAPRSANVIEALLDWIAYQDGLAQLTVPAVEVKGRSVGDPDYVVKLGQRSSDLLRHYIDVVRPLLLQDGDKENPFLFPRQKGSEFKINAPYQGILGRVTRLLNEHVGVRINPHLYRHLIGWIWLKESMNNLPRVQRLLGHESLRTTVEYYAELDENLVMDGWQVFLEDKREAAA